MKNLRLGLLTMLLCPSYNLMAMGTIGASLNNLSEALESLADSLGHTSQEDGKKAYSIKTILHSTRLGRPIPGIPQPYPVIVTYPNRTTNDLDEAKEMFSKFLAEDKEFYKKREPEDPKKVSSILDKVQLTLIKEDNTPQGQTIIPPQPVWERKTTAATTPGGTTTAPIRGTSIPKVEEIYTTKFYIIGQQNANRIELAMPLTTFDTLSKAFEGLEASEFNYKKYRKPTTITVNITNTNQEKKSTEIKSSPSPFIKDGNYSIEYESTPNALHDGQVTIEAVNLYIFNQAGKLQTVGSIWP